MNLWVLRRKVHTSWLIAIGCGGIFVGVFLSQYINWQFISSVLISLASILLIALALKIRCIYIMPLLVIGGLLFGLWRGSISQTGLVQFRPFHNTAVSAVGSVKDDVDTNSANQIVIRLDNLIINGRTLPGVLWITSSDADIKRGDELLLHGVLKKGFGNFSGVIYRASIDQIVHPQPGDVARVVRDWFADGIRRAVPEPESSLGIGYLVGQRRALPADLVLALQIAGLTHVVVASGYNLTILVRLARRLFVKVSKYLSLLSATTMIVMFVAVTGISPSMSRAGLVALLSLLAWYYGRRFHPIVLLTVAIAATVIINPSYAWGDLGWQLSFSAFAGVMILAPLLQRYLFGDKKPGTIRQILGETISAQIVTAPILIMAFGQLSNVAIVANLLVLPLVPLAMFLTFIAGISGLILPAFATVVGLPATWLLGYMVNVTESLSSLPWATSKIQFSWWMEAGCYVIITAICLYLWRVTKYNLREVNLVE